MSNENCGVLVTMDSMRSRESAFIRLMLLVAGLALAVSACGLFNDDDLDVTLDANSAVTSTSNPVMLTVTTTNKGSDRVCWGRGSSSCQLGAAVRVEGREVAVLGGRDCTDDLAELCLAPGDTRTEVFPWDGSIRDQSGDIVRLSQGAYRLRGTAGGEAYSAPVWITVESSQ